MKTMKVALSLVCLIALGVVRVKGQIDTTGPPTPQGALTQKQCSTFLTSGVFEYICQTKDSVLESITCDVHCQCAHNSVWGECVPRPPGWTVGTLIGTALFGNGTCVCYNEGEKAAPATWAPVARADPTCLAFKAVSEVNLCGPVQPRCLGDCVCGHDFLNAQCIKRKDSTNIETNYCECSNTMPPANQTAAPLLPF